MLVHTKDRRHDRLDETHDRIEDRFVSLENRVIEIDRKLTVLIAHLNATDEVDNTGQYTLYLRIRYPPRPAYCRAGASDALDGLRALRVRQPIRPW